MDLQPFSVDGEICGTDIRMMLRESAESYIRKAAQLEEAGDYMAALAISSEGYRAYPENYELAFMIANEHYTCGNREAAYFYYLLAAMLCEGNPEDQKIILDAAVYAHLANLDGASARKELQQMIELRLDLREYQKTFQFVNTLTFSDDPFLFQEVNDTWIRHYQIILEITECEKKRMSEGLTADRMRDLEQFAMVLIQCKFAVRRIWFRIGEQNRIVELLREYGLSPEFIVIVTKCSVAEQYVAAVLKKISEHFASAGEPIAADVILQYAQWFSQTHTDSKALSDPGKEVDAGMTVYEIDADHPPAALEEAEDGREEVAFILCASKREYVEELLLYLQHQRLADGMRGSICIVWNSKSMTSGYNLAMRLSKAKYKIYLHQDTFIFDREYVRKLIEAMEEDDYDLLGLAGCDKTPADGRWGYSPQLEIHMCLYQDMVLYIMNSVTERKEVRTIETAIEDGVLLATRRDVPWREDLFQYYHFYDLSECLEYRKLGYKVGFYNNGEAGVLHEVFIAKGTKEKEYLIRYDEDRETFIRVYTK